MSLVPLRDAADPAEHGGKAANLCRVAALGLRVPESLVVPRSTLARFLDETGTREVVLAALSDEGSAAERARRFEVASRAVADVAWPPELERELLPTIGTLLAEAPDGLAVRSSASVEDSTAASFAGVFESRLGARTPSQVLQAIVACWRSAWSPRSVGYHHRHGLEPAADAMAVLLQPVVPARASGVVTTADPDTGDPSVLVLSSVRGLAVDLLSGSGTGDRLRIDVESLAVLDRALVGEEASLDDAELSVVARAALSIDEHFGRRMDVEFALAHAGLVVVQARPLTALPPYFPHELGDSEAARTWNLAPGLLPMRTDVPAGFVTPLYADLSDAEMWARHQPEDITLAVFCQESVDVNGYRFHAAEPAPLFSDFFDDPSGYEAWLERNEPPYRERWSRHGEELDAIERTVRDATFDGVPLRRLMEAVLEVREALWDLNAFGWSGPQSLGWMCDQLLTHTLHGLDPELEPPFDPPVEVGALIGGGSDTVTFATTRALQELGRSVDEPEVRRLLLERPLAEVVPSLRRELPGCAFLAAFEDVCWRIGRTPPSWHDRPAYWRVSDDEAALVHTIRCALDGSARDVEELRRASLAERDRHEGELRARLAKARPSAPALAWPRIERMLDWARTWGAALNDRHGLRRGLLWERELHWHAGSRLVDAGLLAEPIELLLLRRDAVEALAAGAPPSDVEAALRRSRAEARRHLRLSAPARIGAAPESSETPSAPAAEESDHDGVTFEGVGIGGKAVVGRALPLADLDAPGLLDRLLPEHVLVLPHEYAFHHADWHSLLTLVRAVVSPGRPSHHLAQVARECGVPVVAQVAGDLTRIEEGSRLRVDAASGTVVVLSESDADEGRSPNP